MLEVDCYPMNPFIYTEKFSTLSTDLPTLNLNLENSIETPRTVSGNI